LRLSTNVLEQTTLGPYCRRFPRLPRLHAVARFLRRLWAPFRRSRRNAFPVTLGPSDETAPFRQLHPLRSLTPPANPFASTRVAPRQRSILSWTSAPL